jgi:hypothetical protein
MLQIKFRVLVTALSLVAATTALAETKSVVRRNNFFENATTSPWFNKDIAGASLAPSQDVNLADHNQGHSVSSKPSDPGGTGVQAGQVSSVTVVSNYSIQGWATEAGSFNDFNGIPTGITITFNTSMTFSVDAGNYLTLSANAGNGLGISNSQGSASSLDSGEILHVSDVQVTNIQATGTVPGFIVSNPTITNFGVQVLRSNDFAEASENAGLYSLPPGATPTIGFGDGVNGTGTSQSNIKMENGFDAAGTNFTRYLGAWDLKGLAGSFGLKGIGFQYDLGYDLTAIPFVAGDYNRNGVVDAADYILWRKGAPAADSNGDTIIDQADYNFWAANFGNVGSGSGSGLSAGSVPEPSSVAMMMLGLVASCACRRSGRKPA